MEVVPIFLSLIQRYIKVSTFLPGLLMALEQAPQRQVENHPVVAEGIIRCAHVHMVCYFYTSSWFGDGKA